MRKKLIMVMTVIALFVTVTGCLFGILQNNSDETILNGAVEADESISKITEQEAINIATNKINELTCDFDTYSASYYTDGNWRISFYNEPITCDGGITVVLNESTKEIVEVYDGYIKLDNY